MSDAKIKTSPPRDNGSPRKHLKTTIADPPLPHDFSRAFEGPDKNFHGHREHKAVDGFAPRRHVHDRGGGYRGTSLIRKSTPLGPYRRPMPRVLGGS